MSSELDEAIQRIIECNTARHKLLQDQVAKVELSETLKAFISATVSLDNSMGKSLYGFKNGLSAEQDQSNQRLLNGDYRGSLVV